MPLTLRKRIRRGLAGQGFGKVIQTITRLIGVPLFVSLWGLDLYGEWLIVTAASSYLALSDVGFGTAGVNEMVMLSARDDTDGALKVFQSVALATFAVSLGIVTLGCGLLFLLPSRSWLHLSLLHDSDILIIFSVMGAGIVIRFQQTLLYGGFSATGEYGLGTFYLSLSTLAELAGSVLGALIGKGPIGAAIGSLGGTTFAYILMRKSLWKRCPWLVYGWRAADWATIRRLWAPATAFLAFPLGNALNFQGAVIVIGAALGPSAAAVFSALRTLTRAIAAAVGAIGTTLSPEMARAFGRGDIILSRKLHNYACQVAIWATIGAIVGLTLFAQRFVPVWTNGYVALDWAVFLILLATVAVNSLWNASLIAAYATNNHERIAVAYVVVNVAAVVTAYFGARQYGLSAAALALLVCDIILAFYVIRQSLTLLDQRFSTFLEAVARPPLPLLRQLLVRISQ